MLIAFNVVGWRGQKIKKEFWLSYASEYTKLGLALLFLSSEHQKGSDHCQLFGGLWHAGYQMQDMTILIALLWTL